MKNLISTIIILLLATISFGQSITPQGGPNTLIQNKGALSVDSIMMIPIRDTVSWNNKWGNFTIRPQDNKLYLRRNSAWYLLPTINGGPDGSILWADTISKIATKSELKDSASALHSLISVKEDKSNKAAHWTLSTNFDTVHYASTEFVRAFIVGVYSDFIDYSFKRTIDSFKITGDQKKYITFYRKGAPFVSNMVDSFIDNNTTYNAGWGLVLSGTTFRVDSAEFYTASQIDSLFYLSQYSAVSPIIINTATHVISHANSTVIPGTYTKVTTNTTGHITAGTGLTAGDIPDIGINQVSWLNDSLTSQAVRINLRVKYADSISKYVTPKQLNDSLRNKQNISDTAVWDATRNWVTANAPNMSNTDLTQTANRIYNGGGHNFSMSNFNSIAIDANTAAVLRGGISASLVAQNAVNLECNNCYQFAFSNADGNAVFFNSSNLTSFDRTYYLPDKTDTIALKGDLSDLAVIIADSLNDKLKYSDTAAMLAPYLTGLDTISLDARINTKQDRLDGNGLVRMLGTALSYDNNVYLTTEVDGSTTNEIQTLGRTGSNITLTSGGSVLDSCKTYTGQNGISIAGAYPNYTVTPTYGTTANTFAQGNDSRFHNPITIGTANGLSLATQVLSLTLSSASTTGALSSTDWNTFNNKQGALSGSGVLSFNGTTATYTAGTANQLLRRNAANTGYEFFTPAYGNGTVTSVAMTTPTGLAVSGSPITASGTLSLSLQSGYSIPTTANQTNWNTAFSWGDHAGLYLKRTSLGGTYDANMVNDVVHTNYQWSNTPYGTIGALSSIVYSNDWISQEFASIEAVPQRWIRSRYNGTTWGNWYRLWHSGDFTNTDVSNWNTAFSWGNHAAAGYVTSNIYTADGTLTGARVVNMGGNQLSFTSGAFNITTGDEIYLQSTGDNISLLSNGGINIGNSTHTSFINTGLLPANTNLLLPSSSGTLALTSDVLNLYNSNGMLTSNRTLSGDSYDLSINDVGSFKMHSINSTILQSETGIALNTNDNTGIFFNTDYNGNSGLISAICHTGGLTTNRHYDFQDKSGTIGHLEDDISSGLYSSGIVSLIKYGGGTPINITGIPQGTVTQIAMTAPTGFAVSGSPITSAGTLSLSFASGYSLPTTSSQTNWNTAYGWGNHATAGYVTSNVYTADGTLTGDRTINGSSGSFNFDFTGINNFRVAATSVELNTSAAMISYLSGTGERMLKANSSGVIEAAIPGTDYLPVGYITHGGFTPTITGPDTYTPSTFYYSRVGDAIHVWGSVSISSIGSVGNHSFLIELPISTTVTSAADISGVVSGIIEPALSVSAQSNYVAGYIGGNQAAVTFTTDASSASVVVQFDYIKQ